MYGRGIRQRQGGALSDGVRFASRERRYHGAGARQRCFREQRYGLRAGEYILKYIEEDIC